MTNWDKMLVSMAIDRNRRRQELSERFLKSKRRFRMKKRLQIIGGYALTVVLSMSLFTGCSKKSSQGRPSELQAKPSEFIESARAQVVGPDGKDKRIALLAPGQPIILADGESVKLGTTKYTGRPLAGGQPSEIRLKGGRIETTNVRVEEQ